MHFKGGRNPKELFNDALQLRADERAVFLERVCLGDDEACAEVESLLAAYQAAPSFLRAPSVGPLPISAPAKPARQMIGMCLNQYRVVSIIATGGMGEVYRAVRADGEYEQAVAIKIVKGGMAFDNVLQRFYRERQVMANLQHPGITRLLDGGMTDDGMPYFVMEYVDGTRIDCFCDEHRLSITERLKLFCRVCSAVQFAHQNFVVHRDLKPSNILVTPDGRPKLLDFGIAKLLEGNSDRTTNDATLTVMRGLTPRYASPEQVRGDPITTATDVYSLGVILYELLTGHLPYLCQGSRGDYIEKAICQDEPETPSLVVHNVDDIITRSGTNDTLTPEAVASLRGGDPKHLRKRLRGDLDNVVLMALAKEPSRRYATVDQLSRDIERHLARLPVVARRDTFLYRTNRLMHRNKWTVIAASAFVATLIIGVVGTSLGLVQARRAQRLLQDERSVALQAKTEAQNTVVFLQEMIAAANPFRPGADGTVVGLLEEASRNVENGLADQPELEASIRFRIGQTYGKMWEWGHAEPQYRSALTLIQSLDGDNDEITAHYMISLGRVQTLQYQASGAPLIRDAITIYRRLYGDQHALVAWAKSSLALAMWHGEWPPRWEESNSLNRDALATFRVMDSVDREFQSHWRLTEFSSGESLALQGRLGEAQELFRFSLEHYRSVPVSVTRSTVECLVKYSAVLQQLGEYAAAEATLQEAAELTPTGFGRTSFRSIDWRLGCVRHAQGDRAGAEAYYRRSILVGQEAGAALYPTIIDAFRKLKSIDQLELANELCELAMYLEMDGEYKTAESIFQECLRIQDSGFPSGHARPALTRTRLGRCLLSKGDYKRAESLLFESYPIIRQAYGEKHSWTLEAARSIADLLHATNRSEDSVGPTDLDTGNNRRLTVNNN